METQNHPFGSFLLVEFLDHHCSICFSEQKNLQSKPGRSEAHKKLQWQKKKNKCLWSLLHQLRRTVRNLSSAFSSNHRDDMHIYLTCICSCSHCLPSIARHCRESPWQALYHQVFTYIPEECLDCTYRAFRIYCQSVHNATMHTSFYSHFHVSMSVAGKQFC
jgi:hypothetical protein